MQFLADENCDVMIVNTLRASGHDVLYVAEDTPGASDDEVLKISVHEQRVLITEDQDFCDMIFRDKLPAYAIILLRIAASLRYIKAERVIQFVEEYGMQITGQFVTISVDTIRTRSLPSLS